MPDDLSEDLEGAGVIVLRGDDDPGREFRLGTREYDWHRHRRGQLFCVESGLIHVRTSHGSWLLPPHRAGWIPPGMPHQVSVSGALDGWTVLVTPDRAAPLPRIPTVIGVSELLSVLVRRAVAWPREPLPEHDRQAAVLLDEIRQARQERFHLPMPRDVRVLKVTREMLRAPGDGRTLDAWAEWGGLSPRTLRRLVLAETGMSLSQWHKQARLVLALERLSAGDPVAAVSDALGYETPSSFIAMFRRTFGESPGRLFQRTRAAGRS